MRRTLVPGRLIFCDGMPRRTPPTSVSTSPATGAVAIGSAPLATKPGSCRSIPPRKSSTWWNLMTRPGIAAQRFWTQREVQVGAANRRASTSHLPAPCSSRLRHDDRYAQHRWRLRPTRISWIPPGREAQRVLAAYARSDRHLDIERLTRAHGTLGYTHRPL